MAVGDKVVTLPIGSRIKAASYISLIGSAKSVGDKTIMLPVGRSIIAASWISVSSPQCSLGDTVVILPTGASLKAASWVSFTVSTWAGTIIDDFSSSASWGWFDNGLGVYDTTWDYPLSSLGSGPIRGCTTCLKLRIVPHQNQWFGFNEGGGYGKNIYLGAGSTISFWYSGTGSNTCVHGGIVSFGVWGYAEDDGTGSPPVSDLCSTRDVAYGWTLYSYTAPSSGTYYLQLTTSAWNHVMTNWESGREETIYFAGLGVNPY
jgi:hypothetical protein